jgi:4-diphosphocytidyl-2-C-methyl-D-erythritol kinase
VGPGTPLLLINPGLAVSTGEVFRRWSGVDGGPLPVDWADARNDLEEPATALAPEIAEVLAALRAAGGRQARMSGSGATCFALFATDADRGAAEARIADAHPGWWRLATRIR